MYRHLPWCRYDGHKTGLPTGRDAGRDTGCDIGLDTGHEEGHDTEQVRSVSYWLSVFYLSFRIIPEMLIMTNYHIIRTNGYAIWSLAKYVKPTDRQTDRYIEK